MTSPVYLQPSCYFARFMPGQRPDRSDPFRQAISHLLMEADMKRVLTVLAAAVLLSVPARVQAQQLRKFAGVGTSSEGSDTQIFTASGGVVFELPKLSQLAV